jgi:hypothetical protein
MRLENIALSLASLASTQVTDLGKGGKGLDKVVKTHPGKTRDANRRDFAAVLFQNDAFGTKTRLDAVDVNHGLVTLVDSDDKTDRVSSRLYQLENLLCLGHDAVIGSNHQNNEVGDGSTTRTHAGESGVTRSVEEGDGCVGLRGSRGKDRVERNGEGGNVLGDTTGLAGRDRCPTKRVQKSGLAVVDVAHDGDNRGAKGALSKVRLGLGPVLLI